MKLLENAQHFRRKSAKILVELWEYGIQLRILETFFGEGEQVGKNGLFGPREGEGIGLWDKWRVNVWDA